MSDESGMEQRSLGLADVIALAGSGLLVLALFQPWYSLRLGSLEEAALAAGDPADPAVALTREFAKAIESSAFQLNA